MKRKILLVIFLVILALAAIIFWRHRNTQIGAGSVADGPGQAGQQTQLSPAINGVMVSDVLATRRPVAVMVENHPDSRPQSGLSEADIVYETLAEGGITRFMAVFQTHEPWSIGPIRSAREYYAELAEELRAVYVHVGGSDKVLANISAGAYKNLSDMNEFYYGDYFTRIKTRPAPHNAYNGVPRIGDWIVDHNVSHTASYDPWLFKDGPEADPALPDALHIVVDFSIASYKAAYDYDPVTNTYKRSLAGKPHVDFDTKQQLAATNVVVQHVSVVPIPDDPKLRVSVKLSGSGKAEVYRDGKRIDATWRKQGDGRTRYYDAAGQEVRFNRGSIWVELVPGV